MNRMRIAESILVYRRTRNITQKQFGALVGVSGQAVYKWEKELCCPDISLLPTLSAILGVSVATLLGCNDSEL